MQSVSGEIDLAAVLPDPLGVWLTGDITTDLCAAGREVLVRREANAAAARLVFSPLRAQPNRHTGILRWAATDQGVRCSGDSDGVDTHHKRYSE
jgi:hypothetical protein